MAEQPIARSDKSTQMFVWVFLAGVAFSIPSVALTVSGLDNAYPQLIEIGFGCFFGIFAILIFYGFVSIIRSERIVRLYGDRITVSTISGKQVAAAYLADITHWRETEHEGISQKRLTIFARENIDIDSSIGGCYEAIKECLSDHGILGDHIYIKRAPEPVKTGISKTSQIMAVFAFVVYGGVMWGGYQEYYHPNREFDDLQLVDIADKLLTKPVVDYTDRRENIAIQVASYPDVGFTITGDGFNATHIRHLEDNLEVGDSVFLTISDEEYQKYITKTMPLSFADKHLNNGPPVYVYAIADEEYEYLSVDNIKGIQVAGSKIGIFVFALGYVLTMWTIWRLYKEGKANSRAL